MKFHIGFRCEVPEKEVGDNSTPPQQTVIPRRSVVEVQFPGRATSLAYYNDRFDLHVGDLVYVDGKLEGRQGRVTAVSYNFKIRLSAYQRVIAQVDTAVRGEFRCVGTHFVTIDREAIPAQKVAPWFMAPTNEEDFVSGSDDTFFRLDDLKTMEISPAVAERGRDYYLENRVAYISLDGDCGYAIIEGREPYEVEFMYRNGEISGLTCSCFCSYACKHVFAAMLQLKETLEKIEELYRDRWMSGGYFAAISRHTLMSFAVEGKEGVSFTLD